MSSSRHGRSTTTGRKRSLVVWRSASSRTRERTGPRDCLHSRGRGGVMANSEQGTVYRRWESDMLRLLAENSTEYAIFLLDTEGVVLTWNPGAERVLGYREEEIVGRSSFVIFTPEDIRDGD